eukprot:scaffold18370_cov22-Tisochrysis_lutea.AAC.2
MQQSIPMLCLEKSLTTCTCTSCPVGADRFLRIWDQSGNCAAEMIITCTHAHERGCVCVCVCVCVCARACARVLMQDRAAVSRAAMVIIFRTVTQCVEDSDHVWKDAGSCWRGKAGSCIPTHTVTVCWKMFAPDLSFAEQSFLRTMLGHAQK